MTQQQVQAQQLFKMLALQDSMNTRVHNAWREQGNAWYRAIWVECAELLDHYGWKWWKKQQPDVDQVALELIDIWHFGLSILLQKSPASEAMVSEVLSQLLQPVASGDFRKDVEAFALATLQDQHFHVQHFAGLMNGIEMTFDDLYKGYVGKNVLNFFRQDHGYQSGSYRKMWQDGREDNEHLVEVVSELDASLDDFSDQLYGKLLARYQQS